jgi:kynurenine formamidase
VKLPKRADEVIDKHDLEETGIMPNDTIVISTGWEKRLRHNNYMNKNPGLARSAAHFLVRKKVNAVGIDGPSIDPGTDKRFSAHNILLPSGVLVIENLCNLDKIGQKRFTLLVCPLRIAGASGSPVRALAVI